MIIEFWDKLENGHNPTGPIINTDNFGAVLMKWKSETPGRETQRVAIIHKMPEFLNLFEKWRIEQEKIHNLDIMLRETFKLPEGISLKSLLK